MVMVQVKCAFCNGSGVFTTGGFCAVCRGKGEVSIEEPYRTCGWCGGTGGSKPGPYKFRGYTCLGCKGKGVVHIEEPAVECPACHGTGKHPGKEWLTCIRCGGSGFIAAKK